MSLTAKVGTITRARPELKHSKGKGTPFVNFSIKEAKPYPVEEGWEAQFYDVTAFGKLAEHIARDLDKGDRVGVIGKGEVQEYTKNDGTTASKKVILANFVGPDLTFAGADVHRERESQPEPQYAANEEPF